MAFFLRPLQPDTVPVEAFWIPQGDRVLHVGREEGNDLRLEHDSVSARHARIEVCNGRSLEVVDCESCNGTYVNGVRVVRSPLSVGDRLSFADAEFLVIVEDPAPEPDPIAEAQQRVAELQAQLEGEAQRLAEIEAQLRAERGQSETLREQLEAVSREAEYRRASLEKEQEEKVRIQGEWDRCLRERNHLEAALAEARAELARQRNQLAWLEEEHTRRESQFRESLRQAQGETLAREASLTEIKDALDQATSRHEEAVQRFLAFQDRLAALTNTLLDQWRSWIGEAGVIESEDEKGILDALEVAAAALHKELGRLEPIWQQYGERVQEELSRRCEERRADLAALDLALKSGSQERQRLEADLDQLRRLLDEELRRAQGLSRKGIKVEIPERLEKMVIARDREIQVYRGLVDCLERLDEWIAQLPRSRREAAVETLRQPLAGLLEIAGVEPFEVDPGLLLTPQMRAQVQILRRQGWGKKAYSEQPFQPGTVSRVVRCGYRLGEGDGAVILRKVGVLVRDCPE